MFAQSAGHLLVIRGYTNDGRFIRRIDHPDDAPYGYDVAVKPELNRMVTSSFTPLRNYRKPLAEMDFKAFGNDLLIWDFRARKVIAKLLYALNLKEVASSVKTRSNSV